MLEFLPPRLKDAVSHLNLNLLYELRVRADKPLSANLGGKYVFLGEFGETGKGAALIPTLKEVEDTLFAASGYCVYSVEEQIKRGFVTAGAGERIGIAGTVVYANGSVLSIRNPTSLCIRIPHEIHGCADEIYSRCCADQLRSVLLLAPPGEGKTTILRDLTRILSLRRGCNILVSDERGELSAGDLGATSDAICFADKLTAFTSGIRAMRPEVIVTDELLPEDYLAVKRAIGAGICVFASAHLKRYEDVPEKLFERYVVLEGLGKVAKILDKEGNDVA